jgi:hypothetical protein
VVQRIRRLNLGQRIVLVIAWGAALHAVAAYVIDDRRGGWFGYAPNTQIVFDPGGLSSGMRTVIRIGLVLLWTAVALWLLTDSGDKDGDGSHR